MSRQRISILGLAGNPDTLLARAQHLRATAADPWGNDMGFTLGLLDMKDTRPTFEEVIDFLEANGFHCVDVAGKADRPSEMWDFHTVTTGQPVSEETWKITMQSNLRFNGIVTVRLEGSIVKDWCFDMMRSGLWHLAMLERL